MPNRRSAPKREVIDYWKSGEYGSVGWYVKLGCEHIEIRKRKPPADRMACLQCAGEKAPATPDGVQLDPVVMMQSTEQRTKRLLANRLGVSEDSITVIFSHSLDEPDLVGARVELSLDEVKALLR